MALFDITGLNESKEIIAHLNDKISEKYDDLVIAYQGFDDEDAVTFEKGELLDPYLILTTLTDNFYKSSGGEKKADYAVEIEVDDSKYLVLYKSFDPGIFGKKSERKAYVTAVAEIGDEETDEVAKNFFGEDYDLIEISEGERDERFQNYLNILKVPLGEKTVKIGQYTL